MRRATVGPSPGASSPVSAAGLAPRRSTRDRCRRARWSRARSGRGQPLPRVHGERELASRLDGLATAADHPAGLAHADRHQTALGAHGGDTQLPGRAGHTRPSHDAAPRPARAPRTAPPGPTRSALRAGRTGHAGRPWDSADGGAADAFAVARDDSPRLRSRRRCRCRSRPRRGRRRRCCRARRCPRCRRARRGRDHRQAVGAEVAEQPVVAGATVDNVAARSEREGEPIPLAPSSSSPSSRSCPIPTRRDHVGCVAPGQRVVAVAAAEVLDVGAGVVALAAGARQSRRRRRRRRYRP